MHNQNGYNNYITSTMNYYSCILSNQYQHYAIKPLRLAYTSWQSSLACVDLGWLIQKIAQYVHTVCVTV